jgi:hypothetical protein
MDKGVWKARDEVSFGTEEKGSKGKIWELHVVEFLQTLLVWLTEIKAEGMGYAAHELGSTYKALLSNRREVTETCVGKILRRILNL